jgi:hypothetical protein
MRDSRSDTERVDAEDGRVRPDPNPVRTVGWFFRDGDCIEIERQAEQARAPVGAE